MARVEVRGEVREDEVVEGDEMEGLIHVCKVDGHRGSWGGINSSPSCTTALNALVAAESEVDWEIFGGAALMMDSGWWNGDRGR